MERRHAEKRARSARASAGDWGLIIPAPRTLLTAGFLAFSLLLLVLVMRLVEPFMSALLWAGVLTLVVYPVYRWMLRVPKFRPNTAAAVTSGMILLCVLGPMLILGSILAKESRAAYEGARTFMQSEGPRELAERLARIPAEMFPGLVDEDAMRLLQDRINNAGTDLLALVAGALTAGLNRTIAHASHFLINIMVVILAVFYFLKEGEAWMRRARETVPLSPQVWDHVVMKFDTTLRAVVQGTLFAAILLAITMSIGFKVAGIPLAAFFGMITFFIAPIPFIGPLLIWIPACFYLLMIGSTTACVGLVVYGAVVIFFVDNVLKPYFIGSIAEMPVLFMLIALLGGLSAFGPLGLFLGPVLLAITMAVGGIYREIAKRRRTGDVRRT